MTTIGVFDSGFGGLTVLRELLPLHNEGPQRAPSQGASTGAHYIYLGDTARLPYGSKSRETIARYAVSSAHFLREQGAELLVVACNTATALALDDIKAAIPIPVIGVVDPGAQAALNVSSLQPQSQSKVILTPSDPEQAQRAEDESRGKHPRILPEQPQNPKSPHVLVLATAATTQSHAYAKALTNLGLRVTEKACPLLVSLIEEGWTNHHVTAEVLRIYLLEALAEAPDASILLLGCTHYPLIHPLINTTLHELHHPMRVIDSAEATARAVAAHLPPSTTVGPPTCTFYATDSIEKFQRLGSAFLGQPLKEVRLLDLGG